MRTVDRKKFYEDNITEYHIQQASNIAEWLDDNYEWLLDDFIGSDEQLIDYMLDAIKYNIDRSVVKDSWEWMDEHKASIEEAREEDAFERMREEELSENYSTKK